MKVKKKQSFEWNNSCEQKQLKALQEAIYPIKLRKQLKNTITNSINKQFFEVCLVEDCQKTSINPNVGRKQTFIPIILYILFTNKKLAVNFVEKKSQSGKSSIKQKQKEFTLRQFQQDAKYQNFFQMIRAKIHSLQNDNSHQKVHQARLQEDKQKDLILGKITFKTENLKRQSASIVSVFLSIFFSLLSKLTQSSTASIQKLSIKVDLVSPQQTQTRQESNRYCLCHLPQSYWNFILKIRNVQTIQLKLPFIEDFMHSLRRNTQVQNEQIAKFKEKLDVKDKQTDQTGGNHTYANLTSHLLPKIYRINIQFMKESDQSEQIDLEFIYPLLKLVPNLKVLMLKTYPEKENREGNQFFKINNPNQMFKIISEFNLLLESLSLQGMKIRYDSYNMSQKLQIQGNLSECDHQQVKIRRQAQSQICHFAQSQRSTNDSLFWLQKMQQNCPYLNFVKIEFIQKDKMQERRLSEKQRLSYEFSLRKSKQIINLFFKRGMNLQTYLSTIKVLQSQGFDYEAILGTLDKIDPFTPI